MLVIPVNEISSTCVKQKYINIRKKRKFDIKYENQVHLKCYTEKIKQKTI